MPALDMWSGIGQAVADLSRFIKSYTQAASQTETIVQSQSRASPGAAT